MHRRDICLVSSFVITFIFMASSALGVGKFGLEATLNEGATCSVNCIFFDDAGSLLISGDGDGIIKFWDTKTWKCLKQQKEHETSIRVGRCNHVGTRVASCSRDGIIKIWKTLNYSCMQTLRGGGDYVAALCFNDDDTRLVSGSLDQTFTVWGLDQGEWKDLATFNVSKKRYPDLLFSVCFNHDGSLMAFGSDDNTFSIWDILDKDPKNWKRLKIFHGHRFPVFALCFNHERTLLASGSRDGVVNIWDISGKKPEEWHLLKDLPGHTGSISALRFNLEGTLLASGYEDGTIKMWDISKKPKEWGEGQTLKGHATKILSIDFNPAGTRLASSLGDGSIEIWRTSEKSFFSTQKKAQGKLQPKDKHVDSEFMFDSKTNFQISQKEEKAQDIINIACKELEKHKKQINAQQSNKEMFFVTPKHIDDCIKVLNEKIFFRNSKDTSDFFTLGGSRDKILKIGYISKTEREIVFTHTKENVEKQEFRIVLKTVDTTFKNFFLNQILINNSDGAIFSHDMPKIGLIASRYRPSPESGLKSTGFYFKLMDKKTVKDKDEEFKFPAMGFSGKKDFGKKKDE